MSPDTVCREGDGRPRVLHLVHRFATGGLENGVVNLINHMPASAYRHTVVAVTDIDEAFARRVQRADVEFVALAKPPGHGASLYPRFARVVRALRPAIIHTRNLAALEFQVPAWWSGVPVRIHGEHGRDIDDLDGHSRRLQWMRRAYRPFVQQYVALSRDLSDYLTARVGVPPSRVRRICNGVDMSRFAPARHERTAPDGCPFTDSGLFVVGTVGRMQAVKAQTDLALAFAQAVEMRPSMRERLRLVMVGEGPLRKQVMQVLDAHGIGALAWVPGERADVPDVMRGLDCFVLPSLAEGISNTILEAMSCGLPVLARDVGGNAELVASGETGLIVDSPDVAALARGILQMADDRGRARSMGRAGSKRVEREFSIDVMVAAYQGLYDRMLGRNA